MKLWLIRSSMKLYFKEADQAVDCGPRDPYFLVVFSPHGVVLTSVGNQQGGAEVSV